MNRIYSLVFNRARQQMQVASERTRRSRGGPGGSAASRQAMPALQGLCLALALAAAPAAAQVAPGQLPTGGIILDNSADFSTDGNTMTIEQLADRSVIRWDTFDIGEDARVVFNQEVGDIALNQILDLNPSQIFGRLDATATVFLVNPNGIIFGETASLDVGGLVASTLDINADDFIAGGNDFGIGGSGIPASITNHGEIVAGTGGVTMLAGHIGNPGLIQAELGSINLYGTETATLSLDDNGLVAITLGAPLSSLVMGAPAVIENPGTLEAGATVLLHANVAVDIISTAVNTSGTLRATAINAEAGRIELRSTNGGMVVGGAMESEGALELMASGDVHLTAAVDSDSIDLRAAGDIAQSDGRLHATGATYVESGDGGISLSSTSNQFGGDVSVLSSGNIAVHAESGLRVVELLNGVDSDVVLAGNGLDLAVGDIDTGTGTLELHAGSELLEVPSSMTLSGGNVALAGRGVRLEGDVSASDMLSVASADLGILQENGSINADDDTALNAGTGYVRLRNSSGNVFDGTVDVSAAGDADIRTSGALRLGTVNALSLIAHADAIQLGGDIETSGNQDYNGAVELLDSLALMSLGGDITFASTVAGGHALDVWTLGGAVTFGGAVDGLTALDVTAQAGAVTFGSWMEIGGLAVDAESFDAQGELAVGDDLQLTVAQGDINQSDTWRVEGTTTLFAADGDIMLDNVGNNFGGTVHLDGGAVTIVDSNTLRLGSVVADSLDATAETIALDGNIGTAGDQTYAGATVLLRDSDLNSTSGDITFGSTVDGAQALDVTAQGGTVTFNDAVGGTTALAGLSVDAGQIDTGPTLHLVGDLALAAAQGDIIQSGAWMVGGTTTLDAGSGDITLSEAGNDFTDTVHLTGSNVSIRDSNSLALGDLEVGSLAVTSNGALDLGSGSIAGSLVATSHDGDIGQSGALEVGGTSTVDAESGAIGLDATGNSFGDVVHLSGGTTRIAASGALLLGNLAVDSLTASSQGNLGLGGGDITGNLEASSGGSISQGGALTVAGTSTLDAGSGTIALDDAGNDFVGAVDATGTGITIIDASDLTIAALTGDPNGAVRLEAGGTLALPSTPIDTGTADLVLASRGDVLETAATLSGANVHLQGRDGITLNHVVSGNLIDLATDGVFANSVGSGALDAGDSWRIYLASPHDNHLFNGLDSGNNALWDTAAFDAVAAQGNRYIFAYQPTLTLASADVLKTYGQTIDLGDAYTVSGLMEGVAGAYLADTLDSVMTGAPTLVSAGADATATVAGGPYGIDIEAGSMDVSGSGYAVGFENTGLLTVDPAGLTITAGDAAKTYGQTSGLGGYAVEGLLNADAVTSADLASDGSVSTANVGDYVITVDNASGTGLDNYDITYSEGVLTVGKADLVIRASDASKTIGQEIALDRYAVEGLANDDRVTGVDLSSQGTDLQAPAGSYAIVADNAVGAGLDNYEIEYVDGTLQVTGAAASDSSRIAGEVVASLPPDARAASPVPAVVDTPHFRIEGDGLRLPPLASCESLMPDATECPGNSPR